MLKLFAKIVSSIERVYICFDAVDELLPGNRSELLRALREIINDSPNIRLFLTGRPHIRREFDKNLTKRAYAIQIVTDQEDIARYVNWKMEEDDDYGGPELMPDDLKNDILKTMLEKASDMFLLVTLNIDAILGETSLAKRRKMLQTVATAGVDLDSVYAQTLQRIKEQNGGQPRLGMEVLMWISHAERPLIIDELCHALAIEIGTTDLNPENICPHEIVLRSCLGLVVVDKGASTVRLIHYTLQGYLSLPGVLPAAHQTLALTCLAYLNYDHIKGLPADKAPSLQDLPFLEYSSFYWGIHARGGLSDDVKSLAVELLSHYDSHISATLLFNQIQGYGSHFGSFSLFTGLHFASYFGIVEVVEALIEAESCNINRRDWSGFTPLMWAARQGKEGVVRILLARDDVNPDQSNSWGQTPLLLAVESGHEEVVRLLLASDDVDPNKAYRDGQTPLIVALSFQCQEVVRLLLASGKIDPNKPNEYGQTPLALASMWGHEGVVRLLLARDDVNSDRPDRNGETPLTLACLDKREGVVRLLLAKEGFSSDELERLGQRQFRWACLSGNEEMVRQLLAKNHVNPDEPDNRGRTPLWWAALCGHEGVVKLLLARGDVNPEKSSIEGWTPLSRGAMHGHEMVVGLLLARDDVNPERPNRDGHTPLWNAARSGHEGVVRLLLASSDGHDHDRVDHGGYARP